MARGVTAKTAAELVETHPAGRIQTKIEVFDWLMRNEDKRVGKNPAGYLVASIRADYQPPGDYQAAEAKAACRRGREARRAGQAPGETARQDEDARARAREADLRAEWDRLPESERDAIMAAVKAENPGLGRWKKMLEPLCLAALEARRNQPKAPAQKTLFPDGEAAG